MSILQTLLIFAGIPLAVFLLVAGLVYAASGRGSPRYRPGRPYSFAPVWYVAAVPPDRADGGAPALPAGGAQPALPAAIPARTGATSTEPGGARGTW